MAGRSGVGIRRLGTVAGRQKVADGVRLARVPRQRGSADRSRRHRGGYRNRDGLGGWGGSMSRDPPHGASSILIDSFAHRGKQAAFMVAERR